MSARTCELPESLVICHELTKVYVTPTGSIEALHGVDAAFEAGQVAAVVGSSGSGKSTLLRAIAGLDRPSSGELRVGGHELDGAPGSTLRRHRQKVVSYVAQRAASNFIPHLTLAEQTEAGSGDPLELFRAFGIEHRLGSLPAELSGGEQARAAFALALARGTPIVVADEPTAELDRDSAHRLLEAIRTHAHSGTAFILATHDHDVVEAADRVLRLERGRVIEGDPPAATALRERHAVDAEPVMRVSAVSKTYHRGGEPILALREANVELGRGEVGAVLGRSGSGKSTLLTLLGGWQRPDAGEIRYELSSPQPEDLRWRELAIMPQRFGLLPELTVRENVEYPVRLAGSDGFARVEELLERFGLAELAGRVPAETSIGQQQRAALARALSLTPAVLLADEPTSHQDAGWRDAVWELIHQAAFEGTTCFVATHEERVAGYATRVWTIDEGVTTRVE
jgi:putative ABC transport system ATP-binding protein